MKQHSVCILCGSAELHELPLYRQQGLLQCRNCKFVFCKEIPDTGTLIRHYGTYPRNDDISPITVKRYQELSASFLKYRQNGNWLDDGCGNGHLLAVAAKDGWQVFGTEFTDDAVEICRKKGINMQTGILNPAHYSEGHFDVITFVEVIEHINNPHEELEKFRKLLHTGGIVYLTTPNFNSISRYLLKQNWNIIEYPEHLCYYTSQTIHRLFKQHGFEKISLATSGFSPSRLGRALHQNVTEAKENEESIRAMAEKNILANSAKSAINFLLNSTRKGDTIKALYKKV